MEERLILAQTKNNFAARQPSLSYQLPLDQPRIDWQGPSPLQADDLIVRRTSPSRRRAREFLRLILAASPVSVREIRAAALEAGLAYATLNRARKDLRITRQRCHLNGKRHDYWLLPGQQVPDDPASDTPNLDAWLKKWRELYPAKGNGSHSRCPSEK